jgi:hypothetical protein
MAIVGPCGVGEVEDAPSGVHHTCHESTRKWPRRALEEQMSSRAFFLRKAVKEKRYLWEFSET